MFVVVPKRPVQLHASVGSYRVNLSFIELLKTTQQFVFPTSLSKPKSMDTVLQLEETWVKVNNIFFDIIDIINKILFF
jgi:hypothetical protein